MKEADCDLPIVSICCVTYNHAPFISEAIESFINQKTNFNYEIIINDDASTDNTAMIVEEYQKRYPEMIIFISQKANKFSVGMHPMITYVIPNAKGKYIALCEGDDYWTDENKLQIQVDFLEQNQDFSACSHQCYKLYSNELTTIFRHNIKKVLTTKDLIGSRPFHTASFVYRSYITKKYQIPIQTVSYDKALFLLCSLFGKIRFFDRIMCIYRINPDSITQNWSVDYLKRDKQVINWLNSINNSFPKYEFMSNYYKALYSYPKKIKKIKLLGWYISYLFLSFSYFPRNLNMISGQTVLFLSKLLNFKNEGIKNGT